METPENILLIRFKSIGDVVLTLPAVNAVRDNFPRAKITFLTSTENIPLLRGFRDVNEVIPLDRAALRSGNPLKVTRKFFGLLHRLRAGKFSLVVDFQGYGETAWLTWFTGAPQRWGSVYSVGRCWAYTQGIRRDDDLQIADWNLSLLRQCGLQVGGIRNEFILPEDALLDAEKFFAENNLNPAKPAAFLQPFTSTPNKNWPLENFLTLARHLQSRRIQVIFGGGPSERTALEPARAAGFVVAAGTPLLVSAGLVKLSTVVVGGVTGLLHLAVAMHKRVVMLIGYPAVEPGYPYQHRDWAVVSRQNTGVATVPVADVMAATERAFNESAGNASY